MAAKKYTVLVGCNIPPDDERLEPGDEVFLTDAKARPLIRLGAVERITETHDHPDETAAKIEAVETAQQGDEDGED